MSKLKVVVIFFKLLITLLLSTPFGNT